MRILKNDISLDEIYRLNGNSCKSQIILSKFQKIELLRSLLRKFARQTVCLIFKPVGVCETVHTAYCIFVPLICVMSPLFPVCEDLYFVKNCYALFVNVFVSLGAGDELCRHHTLQPFLPRILPQEVAVRPGNLPHVPPDSPTKLISLRQSFRTPGGGSSSGRRHRSEPH